MEIFGALLSLLIMVAVLGVMGWAAFAIYGLVAHGNRGHRSVKKMRVHPADVIQSAHPDDINVGDVISLLGEEGLADDNQLTVRTAATRVDDSASLFECDYALRGRVCYVHILAVRDSKGFVYWELVLNGSEGMDPNNIPEALLLSTRSFNGVVKAQERVVA